MHVRDDARDPAPPARRPRRPDACLTAAAPLTGHHGAPTPFGVYVHVPFCARRCDYCAFATWTDRSHLIGGYVAACRRELAGEVGSGMPAATSVFFGGGTPSLLPSEDLVSILDDFPRHEGAEITVECNPDSVAPRQLRAYAAAGVNRLSFGVQSMNGRVLAALGRTHDPSAVTVALDAARTAGIDNINADLIFGAAGESDDMWRETLQAVLALEPVHISAYALTVEPGTPLAADPSRHPDDDVQARRYHMAEEILTAAGLHNYEISNWARPGYQCRHNLLYWAQGDYRGIGCAAHSHRSGRRWWNARQPERYLDLIGRGASPVAGEECLNTEARRAERIQLALRTALGVDLADVDEAGRGQIAWLHELGLLDRRGDRLLLTLRGRLLANEVALRLVGGGAETEEPEADKLPIS